MSSYYDIFISLCSRYADIESPKVRRYIELTWTSMCGIINIWQRTQEEYLVDGVSLITTLHVQLNSLLVNAFANAIIQSLTLKQEFVQKKEPNEKHNSYL